MRSFFAALPSAVRNAAVALAMLCWAMLPAGLAGGVIAMAGLCALLLMPSESLVALRLQPETMSTLVFAQWRRAGLGGFDLALVGDSTCVNSLDGDRLSERLGVNVEPLCTLAFVGPRGYAAYLDRFFSVSPERSKAIVVISPLQFTREPYWQGWEAPGTWAEMQLRAAQDRLDNVWGDLRIVFRRGAFGLLVDAPIQSEFVTSIVGGLSSFRRTILKEGLYYGTYPIQCFHCEPEQYLKQAIARESERKSEFPEMNDAFKSTLSPLRDLIAKVGAERIFLIVMPTPERWHTPEVESKRQEAARYILARLGLPESQLLDTPAFVPTHFLPDSFHFHRPGSLWFTDRVAEALLKINVVSCSPAGTICASSSSHALRAKPDGDATRH